MATTVDTRTGTWTVDVGDQLSQVFPVLEDGGAVDNYDDCVVQVDIFSAAYGLLTLRSDDASPQVVKTTVSGDTFATVTLTEADTSANFIGQYRIVVLDSTEDERTTHLVGTEGAQGGQRFEIKGNWNSVTPASFSPVTTPIPESALFAALADLLEDLEIVDSEESSLVLEDA